MLDKNTSNPITSSWKRDWSSTSAACRSTTTLLGWTNHHHRPLIGIVNRMHLIIPVEQNVCIPKEDGDNRWIETIFIGDHRTHRRIIITTNHQPPRKNISALELTDRLTDWLWTECGGVNSKRHSWRRLSSFPSGHHPPHTSPPKCSSMAPAVLLPLLMLLLLVGIVRRWDSHPVVSNIICSSLIRPQVIHTWS